MKRYSIIQTFLISIFAFSSFNALSDENVYLKTNSETQNKKIEYQYIDGKLLYVNKNEKAKAVNNKKIESQTTESITFVEPEKKKENPTKEVKSKTNVKNENLKRPNEVFFVKGGKPCFEEAARYHNVDPWLLMSIAYVESRFDTKAINRNKNGSYDTGMMQINSIWIPTLKKKGIDKSLLNDACASTYIGAWILSDNIKRYGYNWRAIGAYNSGNPKLGLAYAKKVYAAHEKFTGIRNNSTKK